MARKRLGLCDRRPHPRHRGHGAPRWQAVNGLELAWDEEYSHWKRWPNAAAVVARNDWALSGTVMPDTPKPGRGIVGRATRDDAEIISVISWHAPNAAGEGVETKMAGYRAFIDAVEGISGPLVAGIDSNHPRSASNTGDMDRIRELWDPDAIVRAPPGWPDPGPFVGRDAVMQEFAHCGRHSTKTPWSS